MPLQFFGNKFQPARPTTRKNLHFHPKREKPKSFQDKDSIFIRLGEHKAEFIKGNWKTIQTGDNGIVEEFAKLQVTCNTLEEENNLLKIKVELLIDMLTQTTALSNEKELKIKRLEEILRHQE